MTPLLPEPLVMLLCALALIASMAYMILSREDEKPAPIAPGRNLAKEHALGGHSAWKAWGCDECAKDKGR